MSSQPREGCSIHHTWGGGCRQLTQQPRDRGRPGALGGHWHGQRPKPVAAEWASLTSGIKRKMQAGLALVTGHGVPWRPLTP